MTEYVLNAHGKLISWSRFVSSADPVVYDCALFEFSYQAIPLSNQAFFDKYCLLYRKLYGSEDPMNLEEPYTPTAADLDDFAEFQAERNPMFENFEPDKYDF